MAYSRPANLDGFVPLLSRPEPRTRQMLGEHLLAHLQDTTNELVCDDMGLLVDGLMPWISGGNFKVSQNGLDVLTALINRMGSDFCSYTQTVLPHVIDRLGDSKDSVRNSARAAITELCVSGSLSMPQLLAKMSVAFKHKNANMREEALKSLSEVIYKLGTQDLQLKTVTPAIVGLLSDPNSQVRDQAGTTMVDMYKHVGDKLRMDLRKQKSEFTGNKLSALEGRFDEARDDNQLYPSAFISTASNVDETDNLMMAKPAKPVKRTYSIPTAAKKSADLTGSSNSVDAAAGAVTSEAFEAQFYAVPAVAMYSARDLEDICKLAASVVGDKAADWEKRIDALKKVRALLVANAHSIYPVEFAAQLKELSVPFLVVIKELRSQVVREACITIAYMAKTLKTKLDVFSMYIITELINLIPNSAKVISSAGIITIRYVVRYVHAPRIIPVLTQILITSKAKEIRATLSDILCTMLETWPVSVLERQQPVIKEAIKKGCSDADNTARSNCRRAFWIFKKHFPTAGEALFTSLDNAAQRAVERDGSSSRHGSSDSLHQAVAQPLSATPRPMYDRKMMTSTRSPSTSVTDRAMAGQSFGGRSVSAVDTAAAQRAKARNTTYSLARHRPASGTASLPRAKKNPVTSQGHSLMMQTPRSPESSAATRSRPRVSQSQPSSRSSSPTSRIPSSGGAIPRPTRRSSGIPRSLANSRETSPVRTSATKSTLGRGVSTLSGRRYSSERPPPPPRINMHRLLQQSRDAEHTLSPEDPSLGDITSDLARFRIGRDVDNDSEASSICSERSYESTYRRNEAMSWSGSQSRLIGRLDSNGEISVQEIISHCASTLWSDRKEGLNQLVDYMSRGHLLTSSELRQVTEVFSRMFVDSHTKVFGVFLDAVMELIQGHSEQIHDWLYILLTRLLNKCGGDLLGSVAGKIQRVLSLIHESFPPELQMHCVLRFLADQVQKPTSKTKQATVTFLIELVENHWQPSGGSAYSIGGAGNSATRAVQKIIFMTTHENRNAELRYVSKKALNKLFERDPSNTTAILSELPSEYQQVAWNTIQSHIRKNSASGGESPSRGQSTNRSPTACSEEVMRSLRRTTAEIQNYTHLQSHGMTDVVGDTASKDSGISQMSDAATTRPINGINGHHSLDMCDSKPLSAESSEAGSTKDSSPTPQNTTHFINYYHRDGSSEERERCSRDRVKTHEFDKDGFIITRDGLTEQQVLEQFAVLKGPEDESVKLAVMASMHEVLKYGNCKKPQEQFRSIMRTVLALMDCPEESSVGGAVRILVQVCRREEMKTTWLEFFDLILLKLMDKYKVQSKEITRVIEGGMPSLAKALPTDKTVVFLRPIISTREYPDNLCGLKLATELARARPKDITDEHLAALMPGVAALADHENSSVRKAAVFCMVQLQLATGEIRMRPHLQHLTASKIRLLQVYLRKERGEQQTTPQKTPRQGDTKV